MYDYVSRYVLLTFYISPETLGNLQYVSSILLTLHYIMYIGKHRFGLGPDNRNQFNNIMSTVKPVYSDHLMGYFSAFWSSSRWPRAT